MLKLILCFLVSSALADGRVIGGNVVNPSDHPSVVQLMRGSSPYCTANVIGPRTIITAAHCAKSNISFYHSGQKYVVTMLKHPKYSVLGHQFDSAIGLTEIEIAGPYASVAKNVSSGEPAVIFGFGCYVNGKYDGKLRRGETVVSSFIGTDIYTSTGAALCYGDSGGPLFNLDGDQIGINSKGNIQSKSWFLNLTRDDVRTWLEFQAKDKNLTICGVNSVCK